MHMPPQSSAQKNASQTDDLRLLACSSAGYGVGAVASNVIQEFIERGVDVTYCTNPFNPVPDGATPVYFISEKKYDWVHNKIQNTSLYPPIQLVYANIYFWFRALRYVEQHRDEYDAVWLNGPHAIPGYCNKSALKDTVITLHNSLFRERPQQYTGIYGLYYRVSGKMHDDMLLEPGISHITVVDGGIREELISLGVPETHVSYVPNGVDTSEFQPHETEYLQEEVGIPDNHTVLLSLGRMSPQKNPHRLVQVFNNLTETVDNISLVMAGSGELLPEVREQVEQLDLDNVHLPGFVPEERKADLYAGSDFFVMSSAYEGQPLSLFEAMASGLPCIVPDLPNLEIVQKENCGCLVNFESSDVTSEIREYISEDQTADGENAREYTINQLSWERISEQYLQILMEDTDD